MIMYNDDKLKAIFAKNLNTMLARHNKTQIEVADRLGIKQSTFSSWCTGSKMPRMDKVQALADYFGIMKSDLIEEKAESSYITYKRGKFQPLRLKQYRLSVQESPGDVANKLKVPKHVYLGWEDGSMTMFIEQIEEVAEYFGISTDYLYGYTDDPKAGVKGNEAQKKEALTVADDGLSKIKKDTINFINSLDDEQVQVLLDVAKSIYRERGE